ncbi:MAG: HAD family hydrolase [Methyloligellaceae bacterium]
MFDMDGLLLDTELVHKKAFIDTCGHFSINKDPSFFDRLIGLDKKKSRILLEGFLEDQISLEAFETLWIDIFRGRTANGAPVKAGVKDLLCHLNQENLPCAVATSSRYESAKRHLENAELFGFFQTVTGGDQVSDGKPAPEIYLTAAATLSVSPEKCIAFEDSENGVRSAVSAGMTVVQVPDLLMPSEELKSLNHLITETIIDGAMHYGLYPRALS